MQNNTIIVQKINRKLKYKGRSLDREYRLYPQKEMDISDIVIPDYINKDNELLNTFVGLQLNYYHKNQKFYGEILVSKNGNNQDVLVKGMPILLAAKKLKISKMKVRVKVKFKKDQAEQAVIRRLKKHQKYIDRIYDIYEELKDLSKIIKSLDHELYDLSMSVSDDFKEQIETAHFNSLHTPYIYSQKEKIVIGRGGEIFKGHRAP